VSNAHCGRVHTTDESGDVLRTESLPAKEAVTPCVGSAPGSAFVVHSNDICSHFDCHFFPLASAFRVVRLRLVTQLRQLDEFYATSTYIGLTDVDLVC
jgi:hypothetical protein